MTSTEKRSTETIYSYRVRLEMSSVDKYRMLLRTLDDFEQEYSTTFTVQNVRQYGKWFGAWGDGGVTCVVVFNATETRAPLILRRVRRRVLGLS